MNVAAVAPAATTTTVTPASAAPVLGANDTFTITVAPTGSTTVPAPTGVVAVAVDGTALPSPLSLVNGTVAYTTAFHTAGTHTVSATYGGDTVYAASSSSATVTVPVGSFALSASAMSAQQGSSATSTITITPSNGYTGTIALSVTPPTTGASGLCFSAIPNATVSGTDAVTATLTVSTGQSSCPAAGISGRLGPTAKADPSAKHGTGLELAFAGGLLALGLMRRRLRRLGLVPVLLLGLVAGFALAGCGGSSKSTGGGGGNTSTTVTFTVTGKDTVTPSTTSQTTVTLVVHQ